MNKILKKQYKELENYLESISSKKFDESYEEEKESKTVCPFCNSHNVTQDIKRIQGTIDGDLDGSWSLFGGGIHGSIHGDIDTNEVYICQDCKNVWKPIESDYESASEVFYDLLFHFYNWVDDRDDIEFEEGNPEEKYKDLEEKIAAHDKEAFEEANPLRNFYPETIKWYIHNNPDYDNDFMECVEFWNDKLFKEYGFKMPPKPKKKWWEFWK